MRYTSIFKLIVTVILFSGCATLNKSELSKAKFVYPDALQLQPQLDIYGERLDVVRKTVDREGGDSGAGEDMPYHDAGFYLGNNLFYDLNGNLSFLVLDAMGLASSDDFAVRKVNHKRPFNRVTLLKRDSASFSAKVEKGIGFSSFVYVIHHDSLTQLSKGKLGTKALIAKRNGNYEYQQVLAGQEIRKTKNGYIIKSLLNTDNYIKKINEVYLKDDLVVKKLGNIIAVYKRTWGSNKLVYEMKFTKNAFYIYNDNYRGIKVEQNGNILKVYKNQKLIYTYTIIE